MIRRAAALLVAVGIAVLMGGGMSWASGQEVCDGLTTGKIDVRDGTQSVSFVAPPGSLIAGYCVKAGSDRSVPEGAVVYVDVDPAAARVTISHPSGKDVSHFAVTLVPRSTPTPTPTDPEPSPTPTDPEPSSSPTPTTSTPDPEPTESGGSVSDPKPPRDEPRDEPGKVKAPETLPRTGADWQLVALAVSLLAAGGVLYGVSRD